jgi:predicted ester cyclase
MVAESIDRWNERNREGWFALCEQATFTLEGPGRARLTGPHAVEAVWETWNSAFPDNKIGVVAIHGEGDVATHEGLFEGTQSGPLNGPVGTIEATGRSVSVPFVMIYRCNGDRITGLRLSFDQMELLGQLGLVPG